MKAIILAAGAGTRLTPLTRTTPKALVKLAGAPLLEILLHKLIRSGFTDIAVNSHHFAEQVISFLNNYNKNNNLNIHISREEKLLDTGGGIKKMLQFFGEQEPVLVHNVDIISDLDLNAIYNDHQKSGADATLAVQSRKTNRPLLFDSRMLLCGRIHPKTNDYNIVTKPTGQVIHYAFCGIQVIRPEIFLHYPADRFYSIDVYMKNASAGKYIRGWVNNDVYWNDIGTIKNLQTAEKDIIAGYYSSNLASE